MTNSVSSIEMGHLLCKALNIDIKGVTSISIDLDASDLVRVTIGKVINEQEMGAIVEVLKGYHLVPNDDTPFITGKDPITTLKDDNESND